MVFIKKHGKLTFVLATVLVASSWYLAKRENNYFTHLNRITKKFIAEMQKDYSLSCSTMGGELTRNVKKVTLSFFCFEKKTIEEARELEVHCVERFCEMINSNEKIRPYLEKFPFPSEKVEIMIHFYKEDLTNYSPEESISLVMNCRENLYYMVVFDDHRPDQTVLEEAYREAYEKVKGISSDGQQVTLESKSQSQSSNDNKPIINDRLVPAS